MRAELASSRRLMALAALLLAIGGCRSSTAAWDGIWKLNTVKSRLQHAYYFTISTSSDGGIEQKNDDFTFDFRCDGKDYSYPAGKDLTASCLQASAAQWRFTYKRNGTISSDILWDISPDGVTLTIHGKTIQADGSFRASEHVYHRRGGGKGFSGQWQPVDPFQSHPKILIVSPRAASLRLAYPELGEYVDAPLNGTPALVYGLQGTTASIRLEGPLQMHTESSFEGRVVREGTIKLSNDGDTIVQQSWTPDKPSEIDTYVYDKQ